MSAITKLAVLAIAHALLFAGCAAEVGRNQQVLYDADSEVSDEPEADSQTADGTDEEGPSPDNPSGLYYLGHEGVEQPGVEQWLTFVGLRTGAPIEGLSLCEPPHDDGSDPACADTDRTGGVITHWTPADQTYRMLGALPDGTEFVLIEMASTSLINRFTRPVGVLTGTELEASYVAAGVKVEAGRHTVLARARTGFAAAEGVRFSLHALGCDAALAEHGCTGEPVVDGKDDALQAQDTSLGHGLFLDVAPGLYEVRGERNGVACSHAEVRLDGETAQVLAPELDCE